ncbi:MAG: trypsin-like peptidase domain-containing protein [Chlorobi bacterium]|nr:trypsin-like peptidase domain-containing protein [Chlorobiota bacterium]
MFVPEGRAIWKRALLVVMALIVGVAMPMHYTYAQDSNEGEEEEFEVKERLVIENFEEPLGFPFELYETDKGKAELEDGHLIIEAYIDSGMSRYIEFDMPADPDEIVVQAKMKLVKGKNMGLLFLFEDWDNYGWLLLDRNGNLSLGFVKDAETVYFIRSIPVFNFYSSSLNDIKIIQTDKSLKVYVNGYIEVTERAVPVDGNKFGFVVGGHSAAAIDEFGLGYSIILKKEGDVSARFFGSGLILDSFHVLTAYHVVENSDKIYIALVEGMEEVAHIPAKVLYKDEDADVAILKTDSPLNVPLPVPYSIKRQGVLSLGSYVYALGYPLVHAGMGKSLKFQDGKISSKVGFENDPSQYQTTIPGAPGYSGGPVFDKDGNLIGILTGKHRIAENASYVVKASSFTTLLDLIDNLNIPDESSLRGKEINEQVEQLAPYIVIIKAQ